MAHDQLELVAATPRDPSPTGSGKLTSLQFITELARFDVDFNARLKRGPAGRGRLSKIGATPFLMACETAMHGAAYKSVPRIIHLLAQRGADVAIWNRANRFGWTPLHLAHGYRPGNFKPSPETIAALEQVMLAAGVTPPESIVPPAAPDQYAK